MQRRDFLKTAGAGAALATSHSWSFADEAPREGKTVAEGIPAWPVLKTYDAEHLSRIAMPLGGIGTGTVSLAGNGDLRDWEIMNRPAKGFIPAAPKPASFLLYIKPPEEKAIVRAIAGPVSLSAYEGGQGSQAPNHGLPRFRECSFAAAYPFGQVRLSDPGVPIEVRMEAFNPLIPANADDSGIPMAVLRFALHNKTDQPLTAVVCGNVPNFIGVDGWERKRDWNGSYSPVGAKDNRNEFRKGTNVQGIFMTSDGVDPKSAAWGTMALTTGSDADVSYRTGWGGKKIPNALLQFWDDLSDDAVLEQYQADEKTSPMASLASRVTVPPHATRKVTYLLCWHFPNRSDWNYKQRVGNYYTTQYGDAWEVAERTAPRLGELESKTVAFVRAFCDSDLPVDVKEAALFNVSTLRSQTVFRAEGGRMYGWEGCDDARGCCQGSCTHVWNYEQSTPFLFGELAMTMRDVEFEFATYDDGLMNFRSLLPLDAPVYWRMGAADGQMGCVMKMYRDWQLSGDDTQLKKLWPSVKRALEFCWVEGGWDADHDGVMEGSQHNTMDVEYFGPNPQMGFWYAGALRAASAMAKYLGENEFAEKCAKLQASGSRWMDEHLFNGEYYEQKIQPKKSIEDVNPALRVGMGGRDPANPTHQLGRGCLVDQLVGQMMSHICDLGYLAEQDKIRKSLQSVLKYNLRAGVHDHLNTMRTYVLGDETALLMASFPNGRPEFPFPYYSEVMTGFEYTAAVGMLYEGQTEKGLECIRNIRERYDGRKRNPFDEAECGHHYARAMVAWAAVLALTGFHYSAVESAITFAAKDGSHFWSNGYAWGTCRIERREKECRVKLDVLYGTLRFTQVKLSGFGSHEFTEEQSLKSGEHVVLSVLS